MSDNNVIIKIENVSRRFGGTEALKSVSFTINKGEIHALVGENGAGKSTLMKILAGVQTKDSGSITVNKKEITASNPIEARAAGIGMVFQELNLFPQLTVLENIFITREQKNKIGILKKGKMARESIGILSGLETEHLIPPSTRVENLTVADQQIVEISRALSYGTEIIILDEPNSALSESESQALFKIIKNLRNKGITIIYVSHRLEEVFQVADRITVLRDGSYIGTWKTENTTIKEVITAMVGKRIEEMFPPRRDVRMDSEPILKVIELEKTKKLKKVSFDLHEGEVLGFAGLEGCGIENIFQILFGLEKRDGGQIIYAGKQWTKQAPWDVMRSGCSFVPAERHKQGLMTEWSVKDNINLPIIDRLRNKVGLLSINRINKSANKYVKKLNIITDSVDKKIIDLSGGNQQKAVIAKWLATNPKLLIMNDPTRGIDVGAKAEIYKLIDELAREGFAILFTSSEFEEILELSDNILVVYDGEIVKSFKGGDVEKPELMSYVTGGFEKKRA